jgi:hypothetical protein
MRAKIGKSGCIFMKKKKKKRHGGVKNQNIPGSIE